MNHLMQWLAMGGYSLYVWPAYGLVVLVLMMNVVLVKRRKLRVHETLRLWFKR